jgi:dipeptidyl aminopeptidase/acylaminoacyl peptidase
MRNLIPLFLILILFLLIFFTKNSFKKLFQKEAPHKPEPPYNVENISKKVDLADPIIFERQITRRKNYTTYLVSYKSEKLKLFALMHVPNGIMPESGWPVVIINHGYIPPNQYSTINSYQNTSAYFANQGFLVLKPDYRGHDQSEGEVDIIFSRSQYALDVLNLVNAVDTIPQANPDKIFMYGHSLGAEVSLQVAENTDKIKALTLWSPAVADYPKIVEYFLERRIPTPTDFPQIENQLKELANTYDVNQFSSLTYLSKINTPILVHHATTDEIVPYEWGENLVNKLKESNKQVTFHSYRSDNHDLTKNFSLALSRDVEFFKSHQ